MRIPPVPSPSRTPQRRSIFATFLAALAFCLTSQSLTAGSATWNLNPGNSNWDAASNWTPATEPNGPDDTATFDVSNLTNLQMVSRVEVNGIVFNPGASAFTFTPFQSVTMPLILSGAGIENNSDTIQTFVASVQFLNEAQISFTGSASAGSRTVFLAQGAEEMSAQGAFITFNDNARAGSGTFVAAGGTGNGAHGGSVGLSNSASADTALLTANGSSVSGGFGGGVGFSQTATAASATLTASAGTNGGGGGTIFFTDDSAGGCARVILAGNGLLDISLHHTPGVTVASIEGAGTIFLGANNLNLGGSAATTFSGVIRDGGSGGGRRGSLTLSGFDVLTLSGSNTYSGGTTVDNFTSLNLTNLRGSATGSGPVLVTTGELAGNGTIAGALTVGTFDFNNSPGEIQPGAFGDPKTLTLLRTLTFNPRSLYSCTIREATALADKLVANGVKIGGGALFFLVARDGVKLAPHTVLEVIDNTAATPIAGRFSNLVDGSVLQNGRNKFLVNYEGGDGNDLTLTVVKN